MKDRFHDLLYWLRDIASAVMRIVFSLFLLLNVLMITGYFYKFFTVGFLPIIGFTELTKMKISDWGQIATILYGGMALVLGYYFYKSKNRLDEETASSERKRARINFIYEELANACELVQRILKNQIEDELVLSGVRSRISVMMSMINDQLENNDPLLGFDDEELTKIIKVNSYVDNSKCISVTSLNDLKSSNLIKEWANFVEINQEARTICLLRAENL